MSDDVEKKTSAIVYHLHGELARLGPLDEAQVRELIARGKASSATLATIGDDPSLASLGEISAFADCFDAPSSAEPPRAQLPALAPRRASAMIAFDASPAKPRRALPLWPLGLGVAAGIALVFGLTKLFGLFGGEGLPACDSPLATESVLKSFKAQHKELAGAAELRDIRALASGKEERSCAASLVSAGDAAKAIALEYRVYLENKLVETQITKADVPPAPREPAPTARNHPEPPPAPPRAAVETAPRSGGDADAQACQLKAEPDRVIAACSRLLAQEPLDGVLRRDAFRSRGVAYYRRGDYDRALADLAESIRLAPGVAGLYGDEANVFYFKRDYSRAIAGYDKALQLDPSDALAYNNRGCAWVALGSLAAAEADFKRAREHGVSDPGAACKAALASLRAGRRANP